DAEQLLVEPDGLLPARQRALERTSGHVAETSVVAQDHEPALPTVEGAVLERAHERLDRGVGVLTQSLERRRLRLRLGQTIGQRLEIGDGPARRGLRRDERGQRRQDGERDCCYCFSDSHTRFPATVSYVPLPPLDQSQARPGYVTGLHGSGATGPLERHTTSN